MSAYDDAMKIVCEVVQSQMAWQSPAMLKRDLMRAVALLGEPCENCGTPLTWTATAPVANAPMEWRCFSCPVDLGHVSAEHVIEIDENGQVSETVKGPIRDGH
jgi:hypothetical protein